MFQIKMSDGVSSHVVQIDSLDDIREVIHEWVEEGAWGDEGASIPVSYTVYDADADDEDIDNGIITIMVEPNHDALIRAAGGDASCDHDWTNEGEGGCDQNPGVWSVGGTAMVFAYHCRSCGLRRLERSCGSQRNPHDHDTTEYTQPDSWCAECQREECDCELDS